MIRIQFASLAQVDRIQVQPYPLLVDPDGTIRPQDAWNRATAELIGFLQDPDVQVMGVWWEDALRDLQQAIGLHPVINENDQWHTYHLAVETIESVAVAVDGQQRLHRLPDTFRRD